MIDALNSFELELLGNFHSLIACPLLDTVVKAITFTGNGGMIWIICAALMLCFKKTRRCGVAMAIALVLCLLMNNLLLKNLIARPRPFHLDPSIQLIISPPGEYSFPSGHTVSSFAAAFAVYKYNGKWWGAAAFLWAALIAFTRIYLQVHFFTDVIGGAVIGTLIGIIGCFLQKKAAEYIAKRNNKADTAGKEV